MTRFFGQSAPAAHEIVLYFRGHLEQRGMAPASINRHLACLRSLSKLARMLGYCQWTIELPGLKPEKRRDTRGPGLADVRRLLEATSGDTEAETRDYAIVAVLFCCGLRVSELCGLTWEDTDLTRGTTWIRGKGRRERELIPLPTLAADAIRRYAKHRGTAAGPLFRTRGHRGRRGDGRLEIRSVAKILRVLGQRIGLHVWPHALRHASITVAATAGTKAGFNLQQIRAHSRHASIATLQNYIDIHDREATQRALAEMVSEAVRG